MLKSSTKLNKHSFASSLVSYITAMVVLSAIAVIIIHAFLENHRQHSEYEKKSVNLIIEIEKIFADENQGYADDFELKQDNKQKIIKLLASNGATAFIYEPIALNQEATLDNLFIESEQFQISDDNELKEKIIALAISAKQSKEVETLYYNDMLLAATTLDQGDIGNNVENILIIMSSAAISSVFMIFFNIQNIITILIAGFISAWIARRVGQNFLKPLNELTKATELASEGVLDIEFASDSQDEIGILSRSFQTMMSNLRTTFTQIQEMAFVDRVTGLHSRESMMRHLGGAVQLAKQRGTLGVMIQVDLEGFKEINETLGHESGDILLQQFSKRLEQAVQNNGFSLLKAKKQNGAVSMQETDISLSKGLCARLSGDEFTFHISSISSREDAIELANDIIHVGKEPFHINERQLTMGAAVGLTFFPFDGQTVSDLMKSSDTALNAAKAKGKNMYQVYEVEMTKEVIERMELGNDLRQAVQDKAFEVFYQPLVNTRDLTLKSVECLVRWKHPTKGMISPALFIPVAEETGLIHDIGDVVLELACRQSRKWLEQGHRIPIGVNVSNKQFENNDFPQFVRYVLNETGLPPTMLELEITESSAMSSDDDFIQTLLPLQEMGIKFAIDDFGTGYSNVTQFMKMDFDTVKLDQAFVREMRQKKDVLTIVHTLLGMAKNLSIKSVTEGIEDIHEFLMLKKMGCDVIQGYYFSRPLPAPEFLEWYLSHNEAISNNMHEVQQLELQKKTA